MFRPSPGICALQHACADRGGGRSLIAGDVGEHNSLYNNNIYNKCRTYLGGIYIYILEFETHSSSYIEGNGGNPFFTSQCLEIRHFGRILSIAQVVDISRGPRSHFVVCVYIRIGTSLIYPNRPNTCSDCSPTSPAIFYGALQSIEIISVVCSKILDIIEVLYLCQIPMDW